MDFILVRPGENWGFEAQCPSTVQSVAKQHLARLRLKRTHIVRDGFVLFDMLFSDTTEPSAATEMLHWRHLQLGIPRKVFRNLDLTPPQGCPYTEDCLPTIERIKIVNIGDLCELLWDKVGEVKICLRLQGEEFVQLHDPEEIDRPVDHVQGISLAKLLDTNQLTQKMKLVLGYILARSVWQFYNSDWMKTRWMGETIQFIPERDPAQKPYACDPYFAVQFDDVGDDFAEYCDLHSVIHRYPRMLALGVMLIDIGRRTYSAHAKSEAVPLRKRINDDFVMAQGAFKDSAWPAFDDLTNKIVAKRYKAVVKNCFDREVFSGAASDPKEIHSRSEQGIEERRAILYKRVMLEGPFTLQARFADLPDPTSPFSWRFRDFEWAPKGVNDAADPRGKSVRPHGGLEASGFAPKGVNGTTGPGHGTLENSSSLVGPADPGEVAKESPHDSTTKSETVFDSVRIMSTGDPKIAQDEADSWFRGQECMVKAHRFLENYRKRPLRAKDMVKIGILDTGIDLKHPAFKPFTETGQIQPRFCMDFVNLGTPIGDNDGHGTHCAYTILQVCKTARLYVGKVFENEKGDKKSADRIVKASDPTLAPKAILKKDNAFSTIGEEILSAYPQQKGRTEAYERLSGTSMATAVMAGSAALVIEFAKIRGVQEKENGINVMEEQLHSSSKMKAVFFRCMSGNKPPEPPTYTYVRPWTRFSIDSKDAQVVGDIERALTLGEEANRFHNHNHSLTLTISQSINNHLIAIKLVLLRKRIRIQPSTFCEDPSAFSVAFKLLKCSFCLSTLDPHAIRSPVTMNSLRRNFHHCVFEGTSPDFSAALTYVSEGKKPSKSSWFRCHFRSRIAACAGGHVSANIYADGLAVGSEGRGKVVFELDIDLFFEAGILTGIRIPFDLLAGDEGGGGLDGIFEELAEGKGAAVGVVLGGGDGPKMEHRRARKTR
ncbi:MAG: hypothetical protein Q9163_005954 [Psora crenata]